MAEELIECLDIITKDGIGISVWAGTMPVDDNPCNDGPMGANWLDLVYPQQRMTPIEAFEFALQQLGPFVVQSMG